jgi:hypothetical protein
MISKDAIYKYGHFYEKATGKRIIIKDGAEMSIILPGSHLLIENDPLNTQLEIRTDEEIIKHLEKFKNFKRHKKLLEAGDKLYFKISSGIATSELENRKVCIFEVELQESLFMYETTSKSLASCYCIVHKVIEGDLPYFEPIYAYSLNDAYSKTYVHYFNIYGKNTCTAFSKFTFSPYGQKLETLKF